MSDVSFVAALHWRSVEFYVVNICFAVGLR